MFRSPRISGRYAQPSHEHTPVLDKRIVGDMSLQKDQAPRPWSHCVVPGVMRPAAAGSSRSLVRLIEENDTEDDQGGLLATVSRRPGTRGGGEYLDVQ